MVTTTVTAPSNEEKEEDHEKSKETLSWPTLPEFLD